MAYWQTQVSSALPLPAAATSFERHLRELAAGDAVLLLSHAYVRYLGDLSGGQLLQRAVARMAQSQGGKGCAFYDFGSRDAVAALAARLRDALRRAGGKAQARGDFDRLVSEAVSAFERHAALFAELAEETPAAACAPAATTGAG